MQPLTFLGIYRNYIKEWKAWEKPWKVLSIVALVIYFIHIAFAAVIPIMGLSNDLGVGADALVIVNASAGLARGEQIYWLTPWGARGTIQAYQYSPEYAWIISPLVSILGKDFTVLLMVLVYFFPPMLSIPLWCAVGKLRIGDEKRYQRFTKLFSVIMPLSSAVIVNAEFGNVVSLLIFLAPLVLLGISTLRVLPVAALIVIIALLKPPHWLFVLPVLGLAYLLVGSREQQRYILKLAGWSILFYVIVNALFLVLVGFEYGLTIWRGYFTSLTSTGQLFPWGEILTQNHSFENWLAYLTPQNWPLLSLLAKLVVLGIYFALLGWYLAKMRRLRLNPAGTHLTLLLELATYLTLMVMIGQLYELVLAGLVFALIFAYDDKWAKWLAILAVCYLFFEVYTLASMVMGWDLLSDIFPITLVFGFIPLFAGLCRLIYVEEKKLQMIGA
jgi:hypothetical protein